MCATCVTLSVQNKGYIILELDGEREYRPLLSKYSGALIWSLIFQKIISHEQQNINLQS